MENFFTNKFLKNKKQIASPSNAQFAIKTYNQSDFLRALGINENLVKNEETYDELVKMMKVMGVEDISQITTEQQFQESVQKLKEGIKVSADGRNVYGITRKDQFECVMKEMNLQGTDMLTMKETLLKVVQGDNKVLNQITQNDRKRYQMKEGKDVLIDLIRNTKQYEEPGTFTGFSLSMMKQISEIKDWDLIEKYVGEGAYDAKAAIEQYDESHPYQKDKAHEFRQSLRRENEEYMDEKNRLNPEIIKDANILKKNILAELGINKNILAKPGLLVELEKMVDYASHGKQLRTQDDVNQVIQELKESVEVTDTSVEGIKENAQYISNDGRSLDVTEGVKIEILPDNKYMVENTKYGRGFVDENGNTKNRQQSTRTIYREDNVDNSILEKTYREQKNVTKMENIGKSIPNRIGDEIYNPQYYYLMGSIPKKYSQITEMGKNAQYKETWKDTRTPEEQKQDDIKRANGEMAR